MARVVLVHGAFNELWGPHQIASRWVPALRDGLWHCGADIAPSDIGCAFYGDLFRLDPDAGEVPDPTDLASRSGLADALAAMGDTDAMAGLAHAVGEAAHARLLDQIGRFIAAGDVRRKVRTRVDQVLDADTELVVAHSLGTIVSYLVLADRPELTPALITMGSPLGSPMAFDFVRSRAGRSGADAAAAGGGDSGSGDGSNVLGPWPGGVRSWTNIVAVGDPACGGRGLRDRFGDRVVDHTVDNGHRAHDPEPYLNAAVTGRAVAAALGLTGS